MYKFSKTSLDRLSSCHPDLQLICNEGIEFIDFSVVQGHRNKEQQDRLYPRFTKVKYPNSKHNSKPSRAVDVCPFIQPFGVITGHPQNIENIMIVSKRSKREVEDFIVKAYARLMGQLERIAYDNDIKVRLGMDWSMNYNMLDQTFHDLGHIELL